MTRDERDSLRSYRRDVMKAVGAGTVLTALGGTALAQGDDEGDDTATPTETPEAGDGDGTAGTVHEVETLISGPPTNPDRPADFFYQPTGIHVQPGDVLRFVFRTPDHNVVSYHPAFGMGRRMPTGVGPISSPLMGWRPASIAGDQVEPPAEMGGEGPDGDGGMGGDGAGTGNATATGTPAAGDGGDGDGGNGGPVPDTWLVGFDEPGVYDLLCSPHEHFGMAMRVVVGDETDTRFETSEPAALPEPRVGLVGLARVTLTDPALAPSAIVDQGSVSWQALQANESAATPTETPGTEPTDTESPADGS